MLAFLRLAIYGFLILSVLYVSVSLYSRWKRAQKLKSEWEEEGLQGDRDAFVRDGLEDYDESFRRKLILLIYIVPVVIVAIIIYLTNFW